MPLELTATTRALSQQTNIEQQIIVDIEGIPVLFSAIESVKFINYGDPGVNYGDPGLLYGATFIDPNTKPWINLGGTTANIKQQIKSDRGGTASVQKINLNIVDVAGQVTEFLTPGNFIDDSLSARADVYISFKGAAHPQDSVLILSGIIDDVQFDAGSITLQISHPDDLKRAEIFQKLEEELTSNITSSDTTIPVNSTAGYFTSIDALTSYVRIGDEIIEVGGITPTSFTGCIRGSLGTVAAAHEAEDEVSSFYRLQGNPIELALKLMLSGGDFVYLQDQEITNFLNIGAGVEVANSIYFAGVDLRRQFGVTAGDQVQISGASNASNNIGLTPITSVVTNEVGTYLILANQDLIGNPVNLVLENGTSATANFVNEFTTLNEGAGLKPREVDVAQHRLLLERFNSSLFEYDIYVKDTVNLKEFIDSQLYFPSGLFLVPRKGKISCAITVPPLAQRNTKVLDFNGVVGPDKIKISRSTNTDFYNAVVYRFEEDTLEDEFLRGVVTQSATSTNRIKTRNKPLVIESKGLRNNPDTLNKITRQTRRFLDRFQFGAESVKSIQVPYKIGFDVEIADTVIFGDPQLQVADITEGSRDFQPRVMEVVNKTINLKTGRITLDLLDTAFGIDGRYGSIAPSSYIDSGATTTRLPLKRSFGTEVGEIEQEKWQDYIGEIVQVHSPDFTFSEEVRFDGFASGIPNIMLITPLSVAPSEDFIVTAPVYDLVSPQAKRTWKSLHPSFNPQREVVSGLDNFTFDVDDITPFSIGRPIRVHSLDYSIDSTPNLDVNDAVVENISGNTITVDRDLGFTPSAGQLVDLIAYTDGGEPYRMI